MSNNNSIKLNYIFNVLYQLSSIIVPLLTVPYLTRMLHPDGMGQYSYAYSVSYYFYIFIRLGLHSYGNRTIAYVKGNREELSRTFFEIYAFQLFMGIIMTAMYLFYCAFWAADSVLAFIFAMVVIAGSIDLSWALFGLEEFKYTAVRDLITKLLIMICIFAFVKEGDVRKYAFIYSLGFLINQIVVLPIIGKKVSFCLPTLSGIKSHIVPNLVLFLPTIAVSFYKTMDKIMLGMLSNDAEVGYYHSCENIIRVPLALITALGVVMLPRMSNMLANGVKRSEVEDVFSKSIAFAMFVSSSVCFGIMSVSKEFVPLFYGEGFDKCVDLFWIILPSCIFVAFANVIRTQYLLPRKMDKVFVFSLFSGAVVNVIMNAILIPRMASVGAALGTLAAETVVCVFQSAAVFKDAHIGRNAANSIPFLAAGIAMFLLFRNYIVSIPNQIIALCVKILICGAFYLLVLGMLFVIGKRVIKFNKGGTP